MPKATRTPTTRSRAGVTPCTAGALSALPPEIPLSNTERAQIDDITARLRAATALLRQQNLDRAVRLAQMAARHELPKELEEHIGELGRRFAALVDAPAARAPAPKARASLRLVQAEG